jgi:hypothetical protein
MSEINVQLKDGAPVPMPASSTIAEALKKLDRDVAKQALAAKVGSRNISLRNWIACRLITVTLLSKLNRSFPRRGMV